MQCPHCQVDFCGDEIQLADRPSFGGEKHFSRVIGVYDEETDATVGWLCPDCRHAWPVEKELPFGLRTFQLISLRSCSEAGVNNSAKGVRRRTEPVSKKWWRFWK
jgi:hypothetical protein